MDPIEKAEHTMFFNGIYLSCSLKLGSHLEFGIPVVGSFKRLLTTAVFNLLQRFVSRWTSPKAAYKHTRSIAIDRSRCLTKM